MYNAKVRNDLDGSIINFSIQTDGGENCKTHKTIWFMISCYGYEPSGGKV